MSSTESQEYELISLEESLKLNESSHASHCLLYCVEETKHLDTFFALLQLRFDGLIGFPGGEVDEHHINVESIIEATTRELCEEINYNYEPVMPNDWICSHRKRNSPFVQHFFAKQLSAQQFKQIERTHMNAEHFPSESLGVFRVPIGEKGKQTSIMTRNFLTNFLRQRFAGNAKQQLMETIKKLSLLSSDDQKWIELNDSFDEHKLCNQIRVQTLLHTQLKVHYYEESINAIYGLIHIRNDGLFDFIGNTFVDVQNEDIIIDAINKSLNKELGFSSVQIDSNNSFTDKNGLSYLYCIKISSSQFANIECNFTETENFLSNSFGIFRIPFSFCGQSQKSNDYLNRFFRGFLNQNFAYNSKNHLISISDKLKTNI